MPFQLGVPISILRPQALRTAAYLRQPASQKPWPLDRLPSEALCEGAVTSPSMLGGPSGASASSIAAASAWRCHISAYSPPPLYELGVHPLLHYVTFLHSTSPSLTNFAHSADTCTSGFQKGSHSVYR